MYTETQEVFDIQTNAEKTNTNKQNSSKPIEYKKIKDTPFTIVITEEKHHTILIGKYRLNNQPLLSEEECEQYIEKEKWNIILTMAIMVNETAQQLTNNK
jgi:hypothetical protein